MRTRRLPVPVALTALLFFLVLSSCADKRIVPEFALTVEDLRAMTGTLPESVRDDILARPAEFLRLASRVLDEPEELLVLVDKRNSLAADYVPPDLVRLETYGLCVTRDGLLLRKTVMPAVLDMVRAALADGVTVTFSSTYRSYGYQGAIYEREVKAYG